MDEVFMVKKDIYIKDGLIDTAFHGAFKSFRSASQWLVEEGFEVFFDDNLSEFLESETISFIFIDKENHEKHSANIEVFTMQD